MDDPRSHQTGSARAAAVRPVDLRDYVRFSQDAPVRVRVFATDVLTIDLWCVEPQQETAVLTYPDVDVAYTVIGGHGWFVTDEGDIGLAALGSILVPAGTSHALDNRHADPLVVLASAAPPDVPLDELAEDAPVSDEASAVFQRTS